MAKNQELWELWFGNIWKATGRAFLPFIYIYMEDYDLNARYIFAHFCNFQSIFFHIFTLSKFHFPTVSSIKMGHLMKNSALQTGFYHQPSFKDWNGKYTETKRAQMVS